MSFITNLQQRFLQRYEGARKRYIRLAGDLVADAKR